ncbi:SdrD B-like domain-containing protein [Dyadobacter sp. 32]|uniref:SdrD B-like domain-containing protein n=1 Tax=Dyadobacter sp. 32 TaxID=538966 RepID=UPI0011F003B9
MKIKYVITLMLTVIGLDHQNAIAQITGKAWQAFNAKGIIEATEIMQGKVSVEAYDGLGKLVASATTDASGAYVLDVPAGRRLRVSFSNLPEGFVPSAGGSTTYFAAAPAQIQLPLYNPSRFTAAKPRAIQAVYALGSLENSRLNTMSSLVSYPAHPEDSVKYMPLTSFGQTGSIWGLAYDRQHQVLYSAAIAKRLSALGTQGSGGIYATDINGNETKPFVNLDALGFSTGNHLLKRDLSSDWEVASHDSLMFSQVGKVGLGGLDISDDSRYLYTINLYDKHLYRISLKSDGPHAPNPLSVTRFPLPFNSLKGGEARPFAVKYYNGKVYVGVVCDAQQSQKAEDLQAYVYVIDGDWEEGTKGRKEEPKFKEVVHFSLNYKRGVLDYGVTGWYPWTDDYLKTVVPEQSGWMIYPQPILADIEFDTDGSMIVSLMDRLGHQTGDVQLYRPNATGSFLTGRGLSGGDVLRLGKAKNNFQVEQNGQAGARVSVGQSNGEGPGGGEFYQGDFFTSSGITWHHETAAGGIALMPDDNSLLVSVREPDLPVTGGVKWFDNQTGAVTGALSLFPSGMKPGYFWKSNNVGDIEIATVLPSTEVGDRVWLDNNSDGIQGADEPALPGVKLELYRNNQLIGTTISDETGTYRFNDQNVKERISSRTAYEVRIPLNQTNRTLTLTSVKQGNFVEIDNDAIANPKGYAAMAFTTTNPGEHIQNLDAGFQCNDKPRTAAKIDCFDNRVQVSLTGHDKGQKYDLVQNDHYDGTASYTTANSISSSAIVAETNLEPDKPYEATLRVFAPSGCYTDTYISTSSQEGCAFIPENLSLKKAYSIAVYPNPATGPIELAYRGGASEGSIRIQITDLKGRIIESSTGSLRNGYYQGGANLSKQDPGSYLITVKEGNKYTTKSIVKP